MAETEIKGVLVNIDVSDLDAAVRFYEEALDLALGRRFEGVAEMVGGPCPIYLLEQDSGSDPTTDGDDIRDFRRHWTPVHLDFVVPDIEQAVARAKAAGARLERGIATQKWGRIAVMADPFGNGFCLLQFLGRGYDEIAIN
jgi:predicted enzyme related to lactoylglutathione lyase